MVIACRGKINKFCNREFGGKGEFIAGILSEGFTNDTKSSEIAAWELAGLAYSLPEVAEAFGRLGDTDLYSALPKIPGGDEFLHEFHNFLDAYGWRSEMWFEVSDPTWQDEPGRANVDPWDPRKIYRILWISMDFDGFHGFPSCLQTMGRSVSAS